MSEESKVTFVKDDGHTKRWALEKLFYRQDGTKKSLNSKVLAATLGCFMLSGVGYSLIREFSQPTPTDTSGPIPFNGQVTTAEKVQIPQGDVETRNPQSKPRPRTKVIYSGLQVIERPNFGKIPPGTMTKAKFITGASNGPLKAILMDDLIVNGETIASDGTTLVGVGNSNEERLMVQFTKMVFTDGRYVNVQGQACDLSDQTVGVKGKKLSKYAVMLATGAGLNFLGGLAEGLQQNDIQNGVATKKVDLRNAALNGASKAALEQSNQVLSDLKSSKAVVQVESSKEFYILFEGE